MTESGTSLGQHKLRFSRNFRLLVATGGISRTGVAGFQIAVLWIALLITGSSILAGLADGMAVLPLLFSFAFGAYVDRLSSKKSLALVVSAARVFSIFALFIALLVDNLIIEALSIYFVAFVIGLSTDVMNSISASWSKQFLTETQYQSGVSLSQSLGAVAEGLGYAISGVFLILGLNFAIYSFAIIFAVAIIPIILMKDEKTASISTEKDMNSSIRKGLEYVFKDKRLRGLVIIILAINLAFGTLGIFMAYLIQDQFKLSAIYFTTLALSLTIGVIFGSVVGSAAKGKLGLYSIATILPIGLLIFLVGILKSVYPDFAIISVIGILIGVINVVINTAIIKIVDQEMMGRVSGVIKTFGVSLTFLSGTIGGILIQVLTLQGSFYLIGAIVCVLSFTPVAFREFYDLVV
ncbi:MAG: MFS transporter [Thermoplasmata archaeon]